MTDQDLDDLLDGLVAEYSDRVAAGETPSHSIALSRAPAEARPGLERCLKMIDAGTGHAPGANHVLLPGSKLGRYTLVREIGRGGMAIVWLAQDEKLKRAIALKVLRPGLALESQHVDRFRREALEIADLRHPNVVQVLDVGTEHHHHFLAMEYVEGPSLSRVIEALPKPHGWTADDLARACGIPSVALPGMTFEQAAAALLAPIAEALQAAHDQGLIHRDVKPSNILLRRDGTAVIADFGLAKSAGTPALSMTGDILGTPYYMSPEQAWLSEVKIDHRTDIYSLGVTLFELLSGRRPHEGETVLAVFESIKTSIPQGLRNVDPRCSKDSAAVARKAMDRDPSCRYANASEMFADLAALTEGRGTEANRLQGGLLRRSFTNLRLMSSGQPFEYKSARTFLGLPLVHIYAGQHGRGGPKRIAKGWLAIGDVAIGGLAFGGVAMGGLAFGGVAFGILFAFGGLAGALLLAFGGLAVGGFSFGGLAIGYIAFGGAAFGYGAIGGYARGRYALGGDAKGESPISEGEDGLSAQEWFEEVLPWAARYFTDNTP